MLPWCSEARYDDLLPETIRRTEIHFGVVLPAPLVAVLGEHNGGHLAAQLVAALEPLPPTALQYLDRGYLTVDELFGIEPAESGYGSIYCTERMTREWELPDALLLLAGDGHTWLALDYRDTKVAPPVVFVIAKCRSVVPIASSFEDFLARLVPYCHVFDEEGRPVGMQARGEHW